MADTETSRLWHRRHAGPRRRGRHVLATALVIAAAPHMASTASAQQCDPAYGCTPSPPAPTSPAPICVVNAAFVTGGQVATVSVTGAPTAAAIQITLDGVPAGSGVAAAAGSATIAFTVPDGIAPGSHAVFAVGATFSASCGAVGVEGVAGNVVESSPPGGTGAVGAGEIDRGVSGGALARTGIELALLLVIALVLLVAGRHLVASERRRRRRGARQQNVIADLADHSPAPLS